MQTLNILLTSAGRRAYRIQYFKEALGNRGKVFASNSYMTSALLQADAFTISPPIYDDSYIDFLLNYCQLNQISAILSWFDIDLPVLAKNKERFKKQGITVIVSDEPIILICNDKWKTFQFLSSLGLKQPRTYIDKELLKQDIRNGKISFPFLVKPRWGNGSYAIYQVDALEELDILYQKTLKAIFNSTVKYESESEKNACIIMQEKIEGVEYGLDVLNDLNGNYVTTIARQKLAIERVSYVAQIVDSNPFESACKLISSHLKHIADLDIDCFLTASGEIIILDLNCRFGAQYSFAHVAGANFPKQIVEWLMGGSTSSNNITVKVGVKSAKDREIPVRY